jgi:hypothetical protein
VRTGYEIREGSRMLAERFALLEYARGGTDGSEVAAGVLEEPVAAGGSSDGTAHRSTPQAGRSPVSFPAGDRPVALWEWLLLSGRSV